MTISLPGQAPTTLVSLEINAAARNLGLLNPTQTISSFRAPGAAIESFQTGLRRLLPDIQSSGVSPSVTSVLARAQSDQISHIPESDLLHALRVTKRLKEQGQLRGQEAMEKSASTNSTSAVPAVPAVDDSRLHAFFDSHHFESRTVEDGFLVRMQQPGFEPFQTRRGTESVWARTQEDFGPLWEIVAPHWSGDPLGMVLYRNRRVNVAGVISVYGAMQNDWSLIHSGGWQSLGGVMAFSGKSLDEGLSGVTDKSRAMIKWMAIQERLNRIGHPPSHSVNLGPAKSIVFHGPSQGDKLSALSIHARMMQRFGIYIGGNDEGVGSDEGALIAGLAPMNFMGSPKAFPRYRGLFPSPYTADGVFEALLVALEQHVGDLSAPIAFQGFGGVGSRMVRNALEHGLTISGIIEANAEYLISAKALGLNVPLVLDLAATRQLFGKEEVVERHRRIAEREGFRVVENLVEALQQLPGTRLVSPNAGAHPLTEEVLEYAAQNGIRAFVGAANNLFARDALAWLAVEKDILVYYDSGTNDLGATVVLADALALNPSIIEGLILMHREDAEQALSEGHQQGIPPLVLGQRMVSKLWNSYRAQGRAIGAIYPVPDLSRPA